ncbi:hypothetical protein JK361_22840 [Streptomyces sp. 5-8]|uniref:Secreted protein n=1 Tax=Streptomyces musisoli TaxID=2802280 RepID=A0ABS1P4W5_9ACTN|nr:hypothetical protein [Streptomyces musisoli]MBL1107408.1 hypothetical protein [Streptomyces musisoli]
MSTTARGRLPRIIRASCISSALLISVGAPTAIAANQSSVPTQQMPRDDPGGSDQESDSGGSDTSTDSGGNDSGSGTADQSGDGTGIGQQPSDTNDQSGDGTYTAHQPSDTNDQSGDGTYTAHQPSDTNDQSGDGTYTAHQPSDTNDHLSPPSDNGGMDVGHPNTDTGNSHSRGDADNKVPFYALGGDQGQQPKGSSSDANGKTQNLSPVLTQALKCTLRVLPGGEIPKDVENAYRVVKWINAGEAYVQAAQGGDTKTMIWEVGSALPGAVGTTFTCARIVDVYADEQGKEAVAPYEKDPSRLGIKNNTPVHIQQAPGVQQNPLPKSGAG